MRATKDNPNALQACTTPGLLKTFQNNNATLEKIHKSLEEYLIANDEKQSFDLKLAIWKRSDWHSQDSISCQMMSCWRF